jgi:hypothetical protein
MPVSKLAECVMMGGMCQPVTQECVLAGCLQVTMKSWSAVVRAGLPETATAGYSKLPLCVDASTYPPKVAPGPAPKPRLSQEQLQPASGAEPAGDSAAPSMIASGESAGCWLEFMLCS